MLAKNFGVPASLFGHNARPRRVYIFPAPVPGPLSSDKTTGATAAPMRFLEVFKSSYFADVSLNQWMALTPPELLNAHLKLDQRVMDALRKK